MTLELQTMRFVQHPHQMLKASEAASLRSYHILLVAKDGGAHGIACVAHRSSRIKKRAWKRKNA